MLSDGKAKSHKLVRDVKKCFRSLCSSALKAFSTRKFVTSSYQNFLCSDRNKCQTSGNFSNKILLENCPSNYPSKVRRRFQNFPDKMNFPSLKLKSNSCANNLSRLEYILGVQTINICKIENWNLLCVHLVFEWDILKANF